MYMEKFLNKRKTLNLQRIKMKRMIKVEFFNKTKNSLIKI